jgi:hypothetical protein
LPFAPADVCLIAPFENGHCASLDMVLSPVVVCKKIAG